MNLETSFWKSRTAFWCASAVFALSIFFSSYDFAWRPHQSLPAALFFAALAPLLLVTGVAVEWGIGRLLRVPVEWDFLLRVQVWLVLLATPLYFSGVVCERVFDWQQTERAFATFMGGVLMTLWVLQIAGRYKTRANPQMLWTYCAVCALLSVGTTIARQGEPAYQVLGTQPWRWQTHGRVNLAYTEDFRDDEAARSDARNAAELLRRVEKALGASASSRRVNVFLFPSEEALREFAEDDALVGVAGEAGVLVVGYEWEWMRSTLVHELSHFVVAREFGPNVRALPDEGTAVWMEQKLTPSEEALVPRRHTDFTTSELAHNQTFYDEDEVFGVVNYEQAGWLAKTTIQKHGLPKWRRFLALSQSGFINNRFENSTSASAQVAAQYQQIFGEPMP